MQGVFFLYKTNTIKNYGSNKKLINSEDFDGVKLNKIVKDEFVLDTINSKISVKSTYFKEKKERNNSIYNF